MLYQLYLFMLLAIWKNSNKEYKHIHIFLCNCCNLWSASKEWLADKNPLPRPRDPPWVEPFCSWALRNHIYDVTRTAAAKSEIFNISEITSCRILIWRFKPIFSWSMNQISRFSSTTDHYYLCKRKKGTLKNPRWPPISHFISVNVS